MANTSFKRILIAHIVIKEGRQRRELVDIPELAASIAATGLINPITVSENWELICGERRLAACRSLGWTKIEVHIFEELPVFEQKLIEFQENMKRAALTWQDTALAVVELYRLKRLDDNTWNVEKTAELLSMHRTHVGKYITLGHALPGNTALEKEKSMSAASNMIERQNKRQSSAELEMLSEIIAGNPEELDALIGDAHDTENEEESGAIDMGFDCGGSNNTTPSTPVSRTQSIGASKTSTTLKEKLVGGKSECLFKCANALELMDTWDGQRFNFLHCDFPYGINHDESEMGGANAYGSYADSPEVYFSLLHGLIKNIDRLLYTEAHIMFWLSMEYYADTIDLLERVEGLTVYKTPLIWMKSCNTGIVKDPKRTPRNVTEFCLYINRGGKEIITNVANAYAAPSNKSQRLHQSEKPVPVLRHFFRMFVDGYTNMLDPTCGAGSAIRAAESLGVRKALGIDLLPENIETAEKAFREHMVKKELNRKLGN